MTKTGDSPSGSQIADQRRLLFVLFTLDDKLCALDARDIDRIIPALPCREIPGVPPGVVGVFEHHGRIIPVVDLSLALSGRPARDVLSTRLIITRAQGDHLLGLLAEEVTESLELGSEHLQPSSVHSSGAPYLGDLFKHPDGRLVQCVTPARVLPSAVLEALALKASDQAFSG